MELTKMREQSDDIARYSDLISAGINGLGATVIMGYVAKLAKPGVIDAMVTLVAVGAIVATYLSIARATVEPKWKATMIIGGAVVCLLYLRFLT